MSQHSTHGYDMVLELSDVGLTEALAHTILELPIFEGLLDLPRLGRDVPYDWQAIRDPDTPNTIDFDTATALENPVRLDFAFIMNLTDENDHIEGRVQIEHSLSVREIGDTRRSVVIDFTDGVPPANIEVDIDSLPARLSDHGVEVRAAIEEMLSAQLQQHECILETQNLRFEIDPEASESEPLVTRSVELTTRSGSCLAILLTTGGGNPGEAPDTCAIATRPEASVLLMIGNNLLLRRLVCPRLLQAFELTGTVDDFFEFADTEAHLRDPVAVNNLIADFSSAYRIDRIILNSLDLNLSEGQIAVEGELYFDGGGWTYTKALYGSIVVEINEAGRPEFHLEMRPDWFVDGFVHFEWWIWLTAILHGSSAPGGIIPAAGWGGIFSMKLSDYLTADLDSLLPDSEIPAPVLPFTLEVSEAFFDDLSFYGWPSFPERPPEHREPEVWIDGEFEVTEARASGVTHKVILKVVDILQTTFKKSHYGEFRARRSLLVAPFKYNWSLDDVPLEGEATVQIGDAEIRYSVLRDRCELWLASGDSLHAELKVVVEDARGRSVESPARELNAEGSLESVGVSGAKTIMGPVAELFEEETLANELASRGLIDPGEPGPDESQTEASSRVARIKAFRNALSRGMEMDLSDLPFDG